jgi:hypothetical protein
VIAGDREGTTVLDQFNGLPTHALIVHFTVVALPLAALGAILVALVPRVRHRYGLLVGAVTLAACAAVPVTVESGQELFARRSAAFGPDDVTEAGLMEQHRELAEALPKWAVLLLVGVLLVVVPPVLLRRARARRREPVSVGAGGTGPRSTPLDLVADPQGPSWQLPVAVVGIVATLVGAVMTLVMVARVGEAGSRATWSDSGAPAAVGAPPG